MDRQFHRAAFHLDQVSVADINRKLMRMKKTMPSNFARKPRTLEKIKIYNATEYRTLLLYTGPFAFRGVLRPVYYNHFLLLSVAIDLFSE